MTNRILLLSGTSEGPPLARALLAAGFAVHATVTRAEACQHLFGSLAGAVQVEARGFTEESLGDYLKRRCADLVLDATHPFAVRITHLAREVCGRFGVAYVRYERPDAESPPGARLVDSFPDAAAILTSLGGRALLTIGSKQLKHFAALHERVYMLARVLPCVASLEQALAAGFTADRLVALRPPFSRAFNRALLEEYRIDVLVTKASGDEGGVKEKFLAAQDVGAAIVVIRRPEEAGAGSVSTVEDAVAACLSRLTEARR